MPEVVEPGTRLVQRYRLEERLDGAGIDGAGIDGAAAPDGTAPTTYWRAEDELLARPVAVCLIDANGSTAEAVLDAARRAAALPDPRFLRVLDAARGGRSGVRRERVGRRHRPGRPAGRRPAPRRRRPEHSRPSWRRPSARAHDAGLAHLCLQPEHVLRTAHGQLKVAGLAVDAAARGIGEGDPSGPPRATSTGSAPCCTPR